MFLPAFYFDIYAGMCQHFVSCTNLAQSYSWTLLHVQYQVRPRRGKTQLPILSLSHDVPCRAWILARLRTHPGTPEGDHARTHTRTRYFTWNTRNLLKIICVQHFMKVYQKLVSICTISPVVALSCVCTCTTSPVAALSSPLWLRERQEAPAGK